jgi:two-component system OmpR family sensor kinase
MHNATQPPHASDAQASLPGADWFLRQLASSTVGMACWDKQLKVHLASSAWCTWFGVNELQATGATLPALLGAEYTPGLEARITAALNDESVEYDDCHAEGEGIAPWRRIRIFPAAHPTTGEPLTCMLMTDITREQARQNIMQRQQAQILALQQQLQGYQRDTAELERLRTLLDWRTTMLTERNDMLHLLSHEIRQPLNNASAAMQATLKAINDLGLEDATPASRALLRAENVLHQVISTLDNTLAAGTILTLVEKTSPADDTDLPTLIGLTLHDIAADVRPRILTEWLTNTRTVQLHPALMRLAIRNLLHNALAYAPPDSAVVLRISEIDDPLNLIIEVIDQGPGIPEDLRPRLFEKGSRGTNSRHRAGAGLGLFIVHSVMQLHHGRVEVSGHQPHGTIMRLVAPQGLTD